MAEDELVKTTEPEDIDASEAAEKMDYPKLVMFQINRIGFMTAQKVEAERPVAAVRSLEWSVGALESMLAPYLDADYKEAYEAALAKRRTWLEDEDVDKSAVSVRFQLDRLAHLMRVCDRKGILLKHTFFDRIEPRVLGYLREKGKKQEQGKAVKETTLEEVEEEEEV